MSQLMGDDPEKSSSAKGATGPETTENAASTPLSEEHGVYAAPAPVEHGGRVELRLLSAADESSEATYGARWFTANQELEGRVSILSADRTEVTVTAPEALPEWLGAFTTTLVRTTARTAQKDQAWPRRLTRWRKAPDEEKPPAENDE